MNKSQSQQDMDKASNQVVFRGQNEKARKNIDEYNKNARSDGEEPVETEGKEYLFFYCECSNEECLSRIKITFTEYQKLHVQRDVFITKPYHTTPRIEDAIDKTPEYWVIRKHDYPDQTITELKTSESGACSYYS